MRQVISISFILFFIMTNSEANAQTYFCDSNGHYYQSIFIPELIDWNNANDSAIALGGYLATITSQEEQEFLENILSTSYWDYFIGGTDNLSEGTWAWVSGEEWGYTNWNPGEPNNGGDTQDEDGLCLVSGWGYKWNDVGVPVEAFIVEYDNIVQPITQNGDVNCDGSMNILDITHSISYLYQEGEPPCEIVCPDIIGNMAFVADSMYANFQWPDGRQNLFHFEPIFPDSGTLKITLIGEILSIFDTCGFTGLAIVDTTVKPYDDLTGLAIDTFYTGGYTNYPNYNCNVDGKVGIIYEMVVNAGKNDIYCDIYFMGCHYLSLGNIAMTLVYFPVE